MTFMNNLNATMNSTYNVSMTENGAFGFKTTGKKLLDINFSVSSLRNMSEKEVINKFMDVFYENKMLAIKWLFFASDVRGGLGERRLFRICMKYLGENHPKIAKEVIGLIPEYSRWDNMFCLLDTDLVDDVIEIIKLQISDDMQNCSMNKPISLLAKWLPSCNASSKETKRLAAIIIEKLGISERNYRKMLARLRSHLKIVETYMSKKEWGEIDYNTVPSRANLIYNAAFLRNDEERRREYLSSLKKGTAKINAGTLFPHDIVNRYNEGGWRAKLKPTDTTLEALWNSLPDMVNGNGNTICVADGSGSMFSNKISGSNVTALDVANALAIYFSERSSGQFKDKYITFSRRPKIVDFSNAKTLREKIEIAIKHNEVADTNIEAVFDLILNTAIEHNMNQEDLPQNILILSDMEFNSCTCANSGKINQRLFDIISQRYARHGYKLPRLVFWNIISRTGTIPVKENDCGVALVSGFSTNVVKMVMSNSTDPYECLLEQLNSPRYLAIENAIKHVV